MTYPPPGIVQAYYFLNGELLGAGPAPAREKVEWNWVYPWHLAYCCNRCGEIWGRVVFGEAEERLWQFLSRPCEKHTDGWQGAVSGSLVRQDGDITHLPREVLQYEFGLLQRKFEKGILK